MANKVRDESNTVGFEGHNRAIKNRQAPVKRELDNRDNLEVAGEQISRKGDSKRVVL